jgi:hypothetical protein
MKRQVIENPLARPMCLAMPQQSHQQIRFQLFWVAAPCKKDLGASFE